LKSISGNTTAFQSDEDWELRQLAEQQRLNLYDQISGNKLKSLLLVIVFTVVVLVLGYVFGRLTGFGYAGVVFAVILSAVMSVGSWFYSDKIALASCSARPANKKEFAYLNNVVEGLCIAAGLPVPKIFVIDDASLNAFATGRDPQHASIAVTSGLLAKLDRQELEGVIAHELSHVKNFDIRYMTMVAVLVGVVALLSNWIMRGAIFGGFSGGNDRNEGKGSGMFFIIGIALAILMPIFAKLISMAVSRKREFLADADGAMLSRNPQGLASALRKIAGDSKPMDSANSATAPLFISNPFKDRNWLSNLFSTHPPIEERIKRLQAAA